jgi:hypothetical protein
MKKESPSSFGGKKSGMSKGPGLTKKETGFSAKVGKNSKAMSKSMASPASCK